jgi:tetratricopeptide (TPR) repeat protein/pimeloyl-ACP methyl ester carboxylesterase
MPRLTLVGKPLDGNPEPKLSGFLNVQALSSHTISAARDTAAETFTVDAPDDAIIKVEYENEVCEWLRADQFAREIGEARGTGESVTVPHTLSRGVTTRGWGTWVLKALHVMGISPADAIANRTASGIVTHYDGKLQTGLYRLLDDGNFGMQITDSAQLDNSGPYLIFLHGTASSTKGSFGGFWSDDAGNAQATTEWNQILTRYKNRVLALEHPTFSVSPVENALHLADRLPPEATVHLISHSRGGLVGELLCLDPLNPPTKENLSAFEGRPDQELLWNLGQMLATKKLRVQKFVRAACPAVGTILAAKRMDLFLNILLNAIGKVPLLNASLTYDLFKASALELIKLKADPASMPGIEAMMPESPMIHFLNTKGRSTAADLGVIAGNYEGSGFWGSLKSYALRAYYWEDNDIVVNTRSMMGGMERKAGVWEYFEEGDNVNHFHYFRNASTRSRILEWLSSPAAPPPDFERVRGVVTSAVKPIRENAPVAFLVPDVFGSQLKVNGTEIWLNYDALASGGLIKLKADEAEALESLDNYKALVEKLSFSYKVQLFPYDWRKSASDAAALLASEVEKIKVGVHFIGHGMGGLVLREFARSNNKLWQELRKNGSKILMLGSPNLGNWKIARLLWGRGELVQMLALLGRHAESDVVGLLQSFRGLLDLLPEPMLTAQAWQSCSLGHPDAVRLAASRQWRQQLSNTASDLDGMFYVAGTAESTPSGMEEFTADGDGQVTHELGVLSQLRTWYDLDRSHGELPDSVDAVLEILARGSASNLAARPRPATTSLDSETLLSREQAAFFPSEPELMRAALGKPVQRRKASLSTLQIAITHGHLREASHPVLVGHYMGDAIVSAEAQLDRQLNQRLSTRFHMETYAGPLGSVEIVRAPNSNPPGAVVVGLGEVGELTSEKLRKSALEAFLRYALARAEDLEPVKRPENGATTSLRTTQPAQRPQFRSAALTSLLIGVSGGSFLSVRDSIAAITQAALEANRTLARRKLLDTVRIDKLEFIELYEDTAIEAAHAIADLHTTLHADLLPGERLDLLPNLRQASGRRFRKPYDSFNAGWWRRIQITGGENGEPSSAERASSSLSNPPTRGDCTKLVFTALTDRARLEETMALSQSKIAAALIADSTNRVDYDKNAAVALFELLVPNVFKDQARDSSDMVLMLDKLAAQYPWELMTDRTREEEQPLAVQSGMIRQFKTRTWEIVSGPRTAREHNALVIGDTESGLPDLPGAQNEAREVARLLESSGYYATPPLIKQRAGEIIRKLFSTDYRIVHLAGHGNFTPGALEATGMVLGGGMYLSPLEFAQMRVLPELVFVNCCHLGQFSRDKRTNTEYPGALAASVAQTLIQKGVKAVIAAGWAVDDAAARVFATTFYKLMLAGRKFGEAVKQARKEAYDLGGINTWGAYQCYGNPDFALTLRTGEATAVTVSFYSRRENVDELRDIAADAKGSKDQVRDDLLTRAQTLDRSLPSTWRDGEVLCLLGQAYKELGEFSAAISTFREAVGASKANAPVEAIEQLANCLDRLAGRQLATKPDGARENWETAEKLLTNLNTTIGESSERLSLLGGLWKRRGEAEFKTNPDGSKEAFQKSADFYRRAYESTRNARNEINIYSGVNWMMLVYLSHSELDDPVKTAAMECLARAQQAQKEPTFWDRVGEPDSLLVTYLLKTNLDQHVGELVELYRTAFQFGTPSEIDSVVSQWDFIQRLSPYPALQQLINTLSARPGSAASQAAAAD